MTPADGALRIPDYHSGYESMMARLIVIWAATMIIESYGDPLQEIKKTQKPNF